MDIITLDTRKAEIMKHLTMFVGLLKVNTARAYERDIREFLKQVKALTMQETMTYFQELQISGYSASSIDRKKAALSKFFQFLFENGQTDSNPFNTESFRMLLRKLRYKAGRSDIKLSNKPDARHLKWEEVERILACCDDSLVGRRNRVIILLGVYQGLRRSEMVNLRWQDIREEVSGQALIIRNAKGGTATIDLHKRVLDALAALKEAGTTSDYALVGVSNRRHGVKLAECSLNRIVKTLARRAGIKDAEEITAHDLRHTCAVQLLLHGASIERVSSHLRHKNLQTTMTYLKTLEIHQNSAVKFLP